MEELKKKAGEEAAKRVVSGQRIGLGTGSTVRYFLEALGRRLAEGDLSDIVGVPTSERTETLARSLNIALSTLEETPALDLCVDGADEVDPKLNLIKGLGGALLREKIVASASRYFIVIVDNAKLVKNLGQDCPVPVEVLPFGWNIAAEQIKTIGGKPVLRMENGSPYKTDQGNHILDCHFGPIVSLQELGRQLDSFPGALGHGLFLGSADEVIIGTPDGVEVLRR
jgi:ribose 5-phosphate isomerase A